MERNILLTIEYDGSQFSGWQIQPNAVTVQGTLEEALSKFCDIPVKLNGTSRTDAGVHALGQRAGFSGDFGIPLDKLVFAVNNYLAGGMNSLNHVGSVRIKEAEEMAPGFHARFDAKGKKYRYIISREKPADIFRRKYAYSVTKPLDIEAMREAAQQMVGTHDFKAFQSSGGHERKTTVRTIYRLTVEEKGDDLVIEVSGDGFLYNMVRIIVGTLVDIGTGRLAKEQVKDIIESKDRQRAGHTAPAEGLYLVEVYYEQTQLG